MTSPAAQSTDELELFKRRNGLDAGAPVSAIFHAVRSIPYGSSGERSISSVVSNNQGSCSGKHLLLRDLLRLSGYRADIETVKGDFAAAIPPLRTMPAALQAMCREGGIVDFHHYAIWHSPRGEFKLDATWPDSIIDAGVQGNRDWPGLGDTVVALRVDEIIGRPDDVPAVKKQLLGLLSDEERARRKRFLTLLTAWAQTIELGGTSQ